MRKFANIHNSRRTGSIRNIKCQGIFLLLPKFVYLVIICVLFFDTVHSQPSWWCQTVGGVGDDVGYEVIATDDGGVLIVGQTGSFGAGSYDVYVVKLDSNGQIQWTRTVGGSGDDRASDVVQAPNGDFILVGFTTSFGAGGRDVFVVRMDSMGNVLWARAIGGGGDEWGFSITMTQDGGFGIAGYTNSFGAGLDDVYIISLDSLGNLLWTKVMGGGALDWAHGIVEAPDGGFYVGGFTDSYGVPGIGGYNCWIARLSPLGNVLWMRILGGGNDDRIRRMISAPNGGLIVVGKTASSFSAGGSDAYILKLDSAGNILWDRSLGGSNHDFAWGVVVTSDGGIVVCGFAQSFGAGGYDVYVVKLDSSGNLLWTKVIGGPADDYGRAVTETKDGNIVVVGSTYSFGLGVQDIYVVKLTRDGELPCGTGCQVTTGGIIGTGGQGTNVSPSVISGGQSASPTAVIDSGGTLTVMCFDTCYGLRVVLDSIKPVSCRYGSDGAIYITSRGGRGQHTYLWNTGSTTQDIVNLTSGNYSVTVTDTAGCTASDTFFVPQPDSLILQLDSLIHIVCGGDSTGAIYISISGGTLPYVYQWNDGVSTEDRTGLTAGTYIVTISDSCGFNVTDTFLINEPPALNISIDTTNAPSLTVSVVGGTPPYSYLWSTGDTLPSIGICSIDTYWVTILDSFGCIATYTMFVNNFIELTISLDSIKEPLCAGDSNGSIFITAFGGSPPYSYLWQPTGDTSLNLINVPAGTYFVKVTDALGCVFEDTFSLSEPPALIVQIDTTGLPVLVAIPTGGTPPYSYSWNTGNVNDSITAQESGTYWVEVVDANGCTDTDSVNVIIQGVDPISTQTKTCTYLSNYEKIMINCTKYVRQISIIAVDGRTIFSKQVNSTDKSITLPINNYSGNLFMRIVFQDGTYEMLKIVNYTF